MKILLIPNTFTSALGIIAQNIQKFWDQQYCPAQIDLEITSKVTKALAQQYDILFPLYFLDAYQIEKIAPAHKIITGIHSHYIWDNDLTTPDFDPSPPQDLINRLKKFKRVNVVSQRLERIFNSLVPVKYTRCGYDPTIYFPKKQSSEKIIVGWVGNSDPKYHRNSKGFAEYVLPLSKIMNPAKFQFQFADIRQKILTQQEMSYYYNQLDVLLVTAREEGQPMPPVEAAACGVGTISTNIGIIPELITNGISGYIVPRELFAFQTILETTKKETWQLLGQQAFLEAQTNWQWSKVIYSWIDFICSK